VVWPGLPLALAAGGGGLAGPDRGAYSLRERQKSPLKFGKGSKEHGAVLPVFLSAG
jgi:hypothetical protein